MVGAPGADAVTVKLWFTAVAALKFALPAWLAAIVHVPADTNAALAPETVQTAGVDEENVTANADVEVAVRAIGEALNGCPAIAPNVMVWLPLLTVSVNAWVAGGGVPEAVIVMGNTPAVVGVPESTPAADNVRGAGTPVAENVGEFVAVTVYVPATPTVKVVEATLVNAGGPGAGVTVTVAEAGLEPTAFLAVTEQV